MRVLIAVLIASLPLLVTFGATRAYSSIPKNDGAKMEIENLYPDTGLIMDDPGTIGDGVLVTMQNGNVFAFENQDGDWNIGNLVSILFDDNGTEIVYDDIIISYRYAGWISETEMQNWIKHPNP